MVGIQLLAAPPAPPARLLPVHCLLRTDQNKNAAMDCPRHPNPSNSGEEEDRRDGAAAVYPVAGSDATFYGFIEN